MTTIDPAHPLSMLAPRGRAAFAPAGLCGPCTALALALAWSASAGAEVSCPDQLSVQQRADAPDGWSVSYGEQPPRLSGLALFDGPPSNRASLKFDRRNQTGRELTLVWTLRETPRSHYLQCSYERTTATIATALPPGLRQCEVVFDRTSTYPGGSSPVKRNVCR